VYIDLSSYYLEQGAIAFGSGAYTSSDSALRQKSVWQRETKKGSSQVRVLIGE